MPRFDDLPFIRELLGRFKESGSAIPSMAGPGSSTRDIPGDVGDLTGNSELYSDAHIVKRQGQLITGLSVFSLTVLGGLLGMLVWNMSLYPLKTTETIYVTWDTDETRYVRVHRGYVDRTTEEQLIRNALMQYVKYREAIDHVTEKERFDWLKAYTDADWWQFWTAQITLSNPNSPLVKYRKEGMTRDVFINTMNALGRPNEWRIEYTTVDRKAGHAVTRGEWVVILTARRMDIGGREELVEKNPLGLIVSSYTVSARTDEGEPVE